MMLKNALLAVTFLCSCVSFLGQSQESPGFSHDAPAFAIILLGGSLSAAYHRAKPACSGFMPYANCPNRCTPDRDISGKEDCSIKTLYRFMPPASCAQCSASRPCNSCFSYKFMPINECKIRRTPVPTTYVPTPVPTTYVPTPVPTTYVPTPVPTTYVPTPVPTTYVPTPRPPYYGLPGSNPKPPYSGLPGSNPNPENPTPNPTEPVVGSQATSPPASSSGSSELSAGIIAGIVIGSIALVAIIAFAIFKSSTKKQREEQMFSEPSDFDPPTSDLDYAAM